MGAFGFVNLNWLLGVFYMETRSCDN